MQMIFFIHKTRPPPQKKKKTHRRQERHFQLFLAECNLPSIFYYLFFTDRRFFRSSVIPKRGLKSKRWTFSVRPPQPWNDSGDKDQQNQWHHPNDIFIFFKDVLLWNVIFVSICHSTLFILNCFSLSFLCDALFGLTSCSCFVVKAPCELIFLRVLLLRCIKST